MLVARSSMKADSTWWCAAILLAAGCLPPRDTPLGRQADDPIAVDGGEIEAGEVDAGEVDAGEVDAGEVDAGEVDAGEVDAGEVDAGEVDAGEVDAGEVDAGGVDAGRGDGGTDAAVEVADGGLCSAWVSEVIDATPFAGLGVGMIMDAAGLQHVSYGLTDLRYARGTTGAWDVRIIVPATGTAAPTSIALGAGGVTHLASNNMRYRQLASDGTVSVAETVAFAGPNATYAPSLSLDVGGTPNMAFNSCLQSACEVHWARRGAGGIWSDDLVNGSASLAKAGIDVLGERHALLWTAPTLRHAHGFAGGPWSTEDIDPTMPAYYPTLLVEGTTLRAATYDGAGHLLYYSKHAGGGWSREVVDSSAALDGNPRTPAIALGASGETYLAYFDVNPPQLRLATQASPGGAWQIEVVDANVPASSNRSVGLAADDGGVVHLVYSQGPASVLGHAYRAAGAMTCPSPGDGGVPDAGNADAGF